MYIDDLELQVSLEEFNHHEELSPNEWEVIPEDSEADELEKLLAELEGV